MMDSTDNKNLFNIDRIPEDYYGNREEMVRFIPPTAKTILDIGCGEGNFGYILKLKGTIEIWGVEKSENAAGKARDKLDKVLVGDIESEHIELPVDYFDCVVFNDVLEHLQYPWIVLRNIRIYMKPGGYVVASIPNIRFYENMKSLLIKKKWEYTDTGIMDKTHLRYFTVKSIKNLFEGCGYRVITVEGINGGKFPWKFGLLNRILFNALDDMRYMQYACVGQRGGR